VTSDFDRYRSTYRQEVDHSVKFSGQDSGFFTEVKAAILIDLAERHLGRTDALDVLDVGCGVGLTDTFLRGRFRSFEGIDVTDGVLQEAARANPWATYRRYDGRRIPLADARVDLAFAICVVHHVDPPDRPAFVRELARVVKPNGIVAIFEHNPFNPVTRMAVSRCSFDREVVLARRSQTTAMLRAAGMEIAERPYILFFPFRARVLRTIERYLAWSPLGAQYVVVGKRSTA
jgi:SAM-dependent methyltransferase